MELSASSNSLSDDQKAMALGWYGYGHWSAPYWFIGIEPGGDELDACVRMWTALGRGELLDIAAHHEDHGVDWFGETATQPQPTWQKLIWLMLASKGLELSPEATLAYQKGHLGRAGDESALIEISSLPAKHNGVEIPRELFRQERENVIAKRMRQHNPRFLVFYSPAPVYQKSWAAIAGVSLARDVPVVVGKTVCLMTYHPNGEWSKAYWAERGRQLRTLIGAD
jgi:hypothetical protein